MNLKSQITFDDFKKLDIRIGEVLSAEKIPGADKLLKLSVDVGLKPRQRRGSPDHPRDADDLGLKAHRKKGSPDHPRDADDLGEERDIRQIVSGIAEFFPDPEALVGKKYPFLLNIEPRTIKGYESRGMIIAVDAGDVISLLLPDRDVPNGSIIR